MAAHEVVGRQVVHCAACGWHVGRTLRRGDALDADEARGCPQCGQRLSLAVYDRQGSLLMTRGTSNPLATLPCGDAMSPWLPDAERSGWIDVLGVSPMELLLLVLLIVVISLFFAVVWHGTVIE
jgi:hypothetical protein